MQPSDIPGIQSSYRTSRHKPFFLAGFFPSLFFYPQMAWTVLTAARLSKRGRYKKDAWIKSSVDIVRALESVGAKLRIEGVDSFQKLKEPCVFIGNHMSTLETFVLPSVIRPHRPVTFVVKKSLVEYPVFKHVMRSRDPVVVGRVNPREDLKNVLEGGEERLKKGVSIIVFPQSTRSRTLDPEKFNSIGVKLARRAKAPIVPLALKTDAWGNGRLLKDFGRIDPKRSVRFSFGEAMRVEGNGKQEHAAVTAFIAKHLKMWEAEEQR